MGNVWQFLSHRSTGSNSRSFASGCSPRSMACQMPSRSAVRGKRRTAPMSSANRRGRIGVQCKRLAGLDEHNNPYPGGLITRAFLRAEAEEALGFKHDLKLWILVTTAHRDTKVQGWVEELKRRVETSGSRQDRYRSRSRPEGQGDPDGRHAWKAALEAGRSLSFQ